MINDIIKLYVATNGCDECGNGSCDRPFATVGAAQKVIREAIKNGGLTDDAYIYIKGGTYILTILFLSVRKTVMQNIPFIIPTAMTRKSVSSAVLP